MSTDLHQEITQHIEDGSLKELSLKDTFNFECTDECMGKCCNKIDISLDPWDVETMARHLDISGQEFVKKYCNLDMDKNLRWPTVRLKHVAEGPCAFMLEDGKCSIYPARPRNCRTSPVARAVRFYIDENNKDFQEKIFMINPVNSCQGHNSSKTWTVDEWFKDCDAYTYYELSDIYLELVDYSVKVLKSPRWLSMSVAQTFMPFLYAPEILRSKLGITTEEAGHKEFYKRRMKALRKILVNMAGNMGYGPLAGQKTVEEKNIMSIAADILIGKDKEGEI